MVVDWFAATTATLLWTAAVLSPGPAFAAVCHRAVHASRSGSVAFVLGITFGSAVYGSITLFGLHLVVGQLGAFASAIKWVGAAYLIWLGLSAWLPGRYDGAVERKGRSSRIGASFLGGSLLEFGNPKGIAFFVSVFAIALPTDASDATKLATLASGLVIEVLWYLILVLVMSGATMRSVYNRFARGISRSFSLMFIGFGMHLALDDLGYPK